MILKGPEVVYLNRTLSLVLSQGLSPSGLDQ